MSEAEAKIKQDMRELGCTCETQITMAYHLYIYLAEEQLMYNTEYCFNKDIDTLYVVARPSTKSKLNIYVPVPTTFEVTMQFVTKLQTNLCTAETGPTVYVAFVEGDFGIVIYAFTKGTVEIPSAEELNAISERKKRMAALNRELNRDEEDIANDALDGGFVEDNEDSDSLE